MLPAGGTCAKCDGVNVPLVFGLTLLIVGFVWWTHFNQHGVPYLKVRCFEEPSTRRGWWGGA